jgi:hypothetical protein
MKNDVRLTVVDDGLDSLPTRGAWPLVYVFIPGRASCGRWRLQVEHARQLMRHAGCGQTDSPIGAGELSGYGLKRGKKTYL